MTGGEQTPRHDSPPRHAGMQRVLMQRTRSTLRRRKLTSGFMGALTISAAMIATLPLIFILGHIIVAGIGSINLDFFIKPSVPVGQTGGGMSHAIVGTLILVSVASVIGIPVGIGAGLYLAETRVGKFATSVRFLADVLNGLPSIVVGIFVWGLLVRPTRTFSAFAGGVALAVIIIPIVTRTTEEMVRTVPTSLREAALALGYSQWRTSLTVVLRTATAGIVTGVLVGVARVAGETAPVMFTALQNQFFSTALDRPITALPLQIYLYATTGYEEWTRLAWAGALVLVAMVFTISIAARFATRSRFRGGAD